MSQANTSVPKPKNWQDFESNVRVLFACVLNNPNTQQNGRSGQKQAGVDVYGCRDSRVEHYVGVQCKKKFSSKVTDKELRAEVAKAQTFMPPLSEFILVTTAPRDQKIQEIARMITTELATTKYPIQVCVWGWDDVEDHVLQHDAAWKAFDPTYSPYAEQGFETVNLNITDLRTSFERLITETRASTASHTDVSSDRNENNTLRHGQITALQKLIDDGYAKTALAQVLRLRIDEWSLASRSERYRILVCIASAKLKLAMFDEAGKTLLEAYLECPEHKNAPTNRAKGHLLTNDHKEAARLAREIMANDDSNARAAETLIQALIANRNCNEPLDAIPEPLREREEVLISHICFLRARENRDWIAVAQRAIKRYPDSRLLKLFCAEALLDTIVHTDRDVIAGGILSQGIAWPEFRNAVTELYYKRTMRSKKATHCYHQRRRMQHWRFASLVRSKKQRRFLMQP